MNSLNPLIVMLWLQVLLIRAVIRQSMVQLMTHFPSTLTSEAKPVMFRFTFGATHWARRTSRDAIMFTFIRYLRVHMTI